MTAGESTAAVLLGIGCVELRQIPLPALADDDGLLRVEATGVCGSDSHAYSHGYAKYPPPCILGHELVGRIEAVGDRAAELWDVAAGDRVVVEEYLPCGRCASCLAGYYQLCPVPRYGARSLDSAPGLWGGYSEYLYLDPRALLHKVSSEVPPELYQLYIPVSNGLYWVQELGGAMAGSTVVVIGPGPHGLGCVIAARECGANDVILIGRSRDRTRLEVGRKLGADHIVVDGEDDAIEAVRALTGGAGAHVVINAANGPAALATAVEVAAERATIVQAGLAGEPATLPIDTLVQRMLCIKGVQGRPSRMVGPALRLIESGRYPLESMCTHSFVLEETEEALRSVTDDPEVVRAVVASGTSPTDLGG
jgi:threonine dehydrogenase-like Zn-dependent dehydrogenase